MKPHHTLAERIARGCHKKGWITEEVYLLAKRYTEIYSDHFDKEIPFTDMLYQIRCLLSDALRDAGCYVEIIHKSIFTYGFSISCGIIEEKDGKKSI